MCITLYKHFKCSCTEAKSIEPCPKMNKALDLVDIRGIPEDDPRIQRLEDQCIEKSATRYEIQSGYCDLCNASITTVGMRVWLAAKTKHDSDAEDKFLDDIECKESAAAASTRRMLSIRKPVRHYGFVNESGWDYETADNTSTASFGTVKRVSFRKRTDLKGYLPDDGISEFSPPVAQRGKAKVPHLGHNITDHLDKKNDTANAADLEVALAAVLEARADLDDYYDSEDSEATGDDDGRVGIVSTTDGSLSRSEAPSPGTAESIDRAGVSMHNKGKGRQY